MRNTPLRLSSYRFQKSSKRNAYSAPVGTTVDRIHLILIFSSSSSSSSFFSLLLLLRERADTRRIDSAGDMRLFTSRYVHQRLLLQATTPFFPCTSIIISSDYLLLLLLLLLGSHHHHRNNSNNNNTHCCTRNMYLISS